MRNLAILVILPLMSAGCGTSGRQARSADGVVTISIWHPWGGVQKEKFERVVEAFNKAHPKIRCKALFTPNDLSNNQKFFTAVAAQCPPDAVFVDGHQCASWAEQGALQPLDKFIKKAGIKPSDYFIPCWDQNYYQGHAWALTYCADPNFALVWNKKVFREVGLDPEKPPLTIADLDRFNERVIKVERGKIVRMGMIPWAQYGSANSMFTWGWAFGGEFYNPKTQKVTGDEEKVVKALEWMTSWAKKYDVTKVSAFASGFGSREQNPLYTGQVAMTLLHISGLEEIKQYAPNLDYGIGYIPGPPDGEKHSSWVGGWCMAIPKGSRHADAAWEFVRWCCRDPEGTTAAGKIQGLFPGYVKSPYFEDIKGKPGYGQFLQIMQECRHQRPVMAAQGLYMTALGRAVDFAIYGRMTPKQALEQATHEAQAELDLRLAGR